MTFRTIILSTLLFCPLAFAAAAAELSLTPDGAAAYAVRHNPALAAARFRVEEARARLSGSGIRPNPELEWELSQNIRTPEHGIGVSWMQKYPRTARLALEKAVSRAEVAAAEGEVRDEERRLAGEVRAAAVALLALEKERALREKQIANSDELSVFLKKRVQSGEASNVDAAQVDLESKQLGTQVLILNIKKATQMGALRPMLGISSRDVLNISGALADPEELPSSGANVAARGDYRAAQANAEAARQAVELAKANKWEDITVGVSLSHERTEDAPDGLGRDTTLGLKVNMPLPLWNKNESKVREAIAVAKRTEKEIDAVVALARAEAAAARAEMTAHARIVADIDTKLIPAAQQIEEQLRVAYAAGQTPLQEVIRARGKRFELEAQRLDALREYHIARAKHLTATGALPATVKPKSRK
jgi:cobalt-zinc-cadmium efflux system outer membrane protein